MLKFSNCIENLRFLLSLYCCIKCHSANSPRIITIFSNRQFHFLMNTNIKHQKKFKFKNSIFDHLSQVFASSNSSIQSHKAEYVRKFTVPHNFHLRIHPTHIVTVINMFPIFQNSNCGMYLLFLDVFVFQHQVSQCHNVGNVHFSKKRI